MTQLFTTLWPALLIGTAMGIGLTLILAFIRGRRAPRLIDRVEPQLRGFTAEYRSLDDHEQNHFGTLGLLLRPVVSAVTARFSHLKISNQQLTKRLERAGSTLSVTDYRIQQLLCALAGICLGMLTMIWTALNYHLNLVFATLVVLALGVTGYLLRDNLLTNATKKRRAKILAEFPTIAELMALSVVAGETALGAIERVSRTARGELAEEFKRITHDVRAGSSLKQGLTNCSERLQLGPVERFNTGLIIALERGTPLADVMRSQAHDVRELSKRELMEAAGKKEISMMLPLVFGILPLTVIFALLPGISLLNFSI